jgi:hypothetical protein
MMMWLIDVMSPGGGGGGGLVGGLVGGFVGGVGFAAGGFPVAGFGVLELAPQPDVSTIKEAASAKRNTKIAKARFDTTAFPFAHAWKQQLCRGLPVCIILHVEVKDSVQQTCSRYNASLLDERQT